MTKDTSIRSTKTFVPTKGQSAMHLVQSSQFAQRLARILVLGLFVSILAMGLLPWQQSSRGTGQVVAYVPQERQQTVQSPIKGVVEQIAPGLVEGSKVEKGQFLVKIQPFASNLVDQLEGKRFQLDTQLSAGMAEVEALQQQVIGYREAGTFGVESAQELVEAAQDKLDSKEQLLNAYKAKQVQAELNYKRQKSLFELKIKPEKDIEKLKKDLDVAQAELESVEQDIASLKNELTAKEKQLEEKRKLAQTKVDYAIAMQKKAEGSVAKIRQEIVDVETKLNELERQVISAPRDGTIFRMPVYERGQAVKEGQAIMTIVPETTQNAVELMVPGNDMPLVQVGQEVRLQFEGWPAVQFPGWPSVAVGTFSGLVANVDATDDGKGKFRILVLPNENDPNPWPSDRYLRQGVRVNGWVMLKKVTLGYEMWRQLNGFPVIISDEAPGKSSSKPPKIPK